MDNLKTKKLSNPLRGEIIIPPDKSISHRALIFGSLTKGEVEIKNLSLGEDCISTLNILKNIGVKAEFISERDLILKAPEKFTQPKQELYCGNSGTSARLLTGLFTGLNLKAVLTGDKSLSKRPMKRIIEPLSLMGAKISSNDNKLPLTVEQAFLKGISYHSPIPSAQVKSAILLAGLNAEGQTTVYENYLSRNHSELMFEYLGADISKGVDDNGFWVKIKKSDLKAKPIEIPGDISSAAFFMVAGAIVPNSKVLIKNVGINPTRTGILDVFKKANINFELRNKRFSGLEEVADIYVEYSPEIKPFEVKGDIIPRLIDEIPVIAVLATQAKGTSIFKDASDLRNKESDRIKTMVDAFKTLGIKVEELPDGFILEGGEYKNGGFFKTHLDHRLAMSYYIVSLLNKNEMEIEDFNCINTSFPEFPEKFKQLI